MTGAPSTAKKRAPSKKNKRSSRAPISEHPENQHEAAQRPRNDSHATTAPSSAAARLAASQPQAKNDGRPQASRTTSVPKRKAKAASAGTGLTNSQSPAQTVPPRHPRKSNASPGAAVDSVRLRGSIANIASGSVTAGHHRMTSASYSSQVPPFNASSPSRHGSIKSRWVRGMSEMMAVARLQRAARHFLMRRALERIPVFVGEREDSVNALHGEVTQSHSQPQPESQQQGDLHTHLNSQAGEATAAAAVLTSSSSSSSLLVPRPVVTESRLVHRIRAELHRFEQLQNLRVAIAMRTLTAALRRWVRVCRDRKAGRIGTHDDDDDDLHHLELFARYAHLANGGANGAAVVATVQTALRACESCTVAKKLAEQRRQRRAAMAIQRAWRRSVPYREHIRLVHDRHAREVLCRHEALERRELLRRHLVFLVRCHQRLYNDPCMWEAGLAVRRLPLYTADGLYLSQAGSSYLGGPMQLLAATTQRSDGAHVNDDNDEMYAPYATIPKLLHVVESPHSTAGLSETHYVDTREDAQAKGRDGATAWFDREDLDVDAGLRFCQYRLFFSTEDCRLLADVSVLDDSAYSQGDAAEPAQLTASTEAPVSTMASLYYDGQQGEQRTVRPQRAEEETAAHSKAFAAALTFLREPSVVLPPTQRTVQHVEAMRRDPVLLERVLRANGHLSADLVAPLTTYALHYQSVARGEEDEGVLSSTEFLQLCQPLVAGVVANPALNLRNSLVGVAVRRRGGAEAQLPVALEELRWRDDVAVRKRSAEDGARPQDGPSLPIAAAGLQRGGFASPATQAMLYAAAPLPDDVAMRGKASTPPAAVDSGEEQQAAAWDHRLAAGIDEVGVEWRNFLLSVSVTPREASPVRSTLAAAIATAVIGSTPASAIDAKRRRIGFQSTLAPTTAATPTATPLLLRDFEPATRLPTDPDVSAGKRSTSVSRNSAPAITTSGSRASKSDRPVLVVRAEEWCDAVERLLIQERTARAALASNEADQRRSIGVLRRMARTAAP